ncbi:hypothetical protein [Paraburkholderia sediminicola]|uniref:hypothetical protein n=1 Tax=Paraburkholderia sediminicola TaxID=458836 RepID=UPI0038BDE900
MKLIYPLLLNAKPQGKPYKIRDRDSMYPRVIPDGFRRFGVTAHSGDHHRWLAVDLERAPGDLPKHPRQTVAYDSLAICGLCRTVSIQRR